MTSRLRVLRTFGTDEDQTYDPRAAEHSEHLFIDFLFILFRNSVARRAKYVQTSAIVSNGQCCLYATSRKNPERTLPEADSRDVPSSWPSSCSRSGTRGTPTSEQINIGWQENVLEITKKSGGV